MLFLPNKWRAWISENHESRTTASRRKATISNFTGAPLSNLLLPTKKKSRFVIMTAYLTYLFTVTRAKKHEARGTRHKHEG